MKLKKEPLRLIYSVFGVLLLAFGLVGMVRYAAAESWLPIVVFVIMMIAGLWVLGKAAE